MLTLNRVCRKCHNIKPKSDFSLNKNCKEGIEHTCRACASAKKVSWEKRNHSKHRDSYYKWRYKISLKDYEAILKSQDYKCLLCKSFKLDKTNYRLSVDHCHRTGKVRGILCRRCNNGLGMFRDSTVLLKKAIAYLNRKDLRKC